MGGRTPSAGRSTPGPRPHGHRRAAVGLRRHGCRLPSGQATRTEARRESVARRGGCQLTAIWLVAWLTRLVPWLAPRRCLADRVIDGPEHRSQATSGWFPPWFPRLLRSVTKMVTTESPTTKTPGSNPFSHPPSRCRRTESFGGQLKLGCPLSLEPPGVRPGIHRGIHGFQHRTRPRPRAPLQPPPRLIPL
jgi:hypothetical protein